MVSIGACSIAIDMYSIVPKIFERSWWAEAVNNMPIVKMLRPGLNDSGPPRGSLETGKLADIVAVSEFEWEKDAA